MRKILLFSLVFLFGCSKGDGDSSVSKFRDLHGSIYWYTSQHGGYWVTFSNEYLLKEIYPPDPDDDNCTIYFEGEYINQEYDGQTYSGLNKVLTESENYYSFSMTSTNDSGMFFESIHQFEVVDNKLYWTPPSGFFDNDILEFIPSQGPPSSQGNNCYIAYTL